MRIVFAGTPEFAARALAALIAAAPAQGWSVPLVLSQPDRPAGRGLRLMPTPVKALAQDINAFIFSRYTRIFGFVGTAGTTPFAAVSSG